MKWTRFSLILWLLFPAVVSVQAASLSDDEKAWLKLVDFIITVDERREFRKRLTTSYQRQQFIQLFWAKRDPDLTDNVNPFKDEYLARYDYVVTTYENGQKKRIPKDERSYIYMMLGKPDRLDLRVDVTIMGPRYRNRFFQHPPELWVYESVGFEYQRRRLKIQMAPSSVFGDFIGVTDAYTSNWLRNLKYKFIVHPDLETPPPSFAEGGNFTGVVEAPPSQQPPQAVSPSAAADTTAPAATPGQEAPGNEVAATPTDATPREDAERELAVPSPLAPQTAEASRFTLEAGNPLDVATSVGYFRGGRDRNLMLARVGFPLEKLNFVFEDDQYQGDFTFIYALEDEAGRMLAGDTVDSRISIPDLDAAKRRGAMYDRELAVLVDPGRYRLRAQLKVGEQTSFVQSDITASPLSDTTATTTPLMMMNPNVSVEKAKFNIGGKPFALHLGDRHEKGDPLYPVIEVLGKPTEEEMDSFQIQAIRDGETVKTWVLYPEESEQTPQGSVLAYPVLLTNNLPIGDYRLRFEMEREDGGLLVAETAIKLVSGSRERR